jgi:hypothetical protein
MATDPKTIAAWIGLPTALAVLLVTLWTGIGYAVRENLEDAGLMAVPTAVDSLWKLVRYHDSLTAANAAYRRRLICRDRGYSLENCPLLVTGDEALMPADTALTLPAIEEG